MNEFRDTQSSLMKFAAEFAAPRGLLAINLDNFANPMEWPEGDFIAIAEFQMDIDHPFVMPALAFVISTKEDTNLFRMAELVNELLNELLPGKRIKMIDATSGVTRGWLSVLNQTRVGTVEQTDSQPARPIMVRFKSDQTL